MKQDDTDPAHGRKTLTFNDPGGHAEAFNAFCKRENHSLMDGYRAAFITWQHMPLAFRVRSARDVSVGATISNAMWRDIAMAVHRIVREYEDRELADRIVDDAAKNQPKTRQKPRRRGSGAA
jgi:hypothetical protein